MSRELDCRKSDNVKLSPARQTRLNELASYVSDSLPGRHRIRIARFDSLSGNPATIVSESAEVEAGGYVERALAHLRSIRNALGFAANQEADFIPDPDYQTSSSGAVSVHVQQAYMNIPILDAAQTVRFAPDGRLQDTVGTSVTIDREASAAPTLSVEEAVLAAARHVAQPTDDEQGAVDEFGQTLEYSSVNVSNFRPEVVHRVSDDPRQTTTVDSGPFEHSIRAALIWMQVGDDLRLAWEVIIIMPNNEAQYRTLVDAHNGEILFCIQTVQYVTARGNVYRVDGGGVRQMTDFPIPLTEYGLPIPDDLNGNFPRPWVESNKSEGNSTFAHEGVAGSTTQGSSQNGVLTFDPNNPDGIDQMVLNIFYLNCYMHDFFYLLGFREADGNFQHDNLGRGGFARDRVDARAHNAQVSGTANMLTRFDGVMPIMNMGLVVSTGRHTAFDSSVVYHEFTHGVTNRLVGGPGNDLALIAPQSRGMGEGWSDYIACTVNNANVVGSWVVSNPGGIRRYPYDSDYPDHFGMLGTGRYNGSAPHPIGEIWCATLMEMNRNIGKELGAQLVVDALKLSAANPGFLDMRDAILKALENKLSAGQIRGKDHTDARNGIWRAFAKFGMGPNAHSNGPYLSGIVADFEVPSAPPKSTRANAIYALESAAKVTAGKVRSHNGAVPQIDEVSEMTRTLFEDYLDILDNAAEGEETGIVENFSLLGLQPPLRPMVYYNGKVFLAGEPAPTGAILFARIDEYQTEHQAAITDGGNYGFLKVTPADAKYKGRPIEFILRTSDGKEGKASETDTFVEGKVTSHMEFHVPSVGTEEPGGGGGSGGGGSSDTQIVAPRGSHALNAAAEVVAAIVAAKGGDNSPSLDEISTMTRRLFEDYQEMLDGVDE